MRVFQRKALPLAVAGGVILLSQATHAAPALEEIIVTAEKRQESLQDVPISIAAFPQDTLEKLGITDIKGLASQVPNVVINEFTGSSTTVRLFMRGVGQNDVQVTQDPSVALYMDGVYIGSSVGTSFETADIQRIEVLRGPQGTLYGRNATGGAINLITNQADPGGFAFKQTLTGGNLDLFRSRTIANFPLTNSTAVKFAYSYSDRDGTVDNHGNGKDWGVEERENFTGDFHWDINDNQAVDYKYEHSKIKDTSRLSQILYFDSTAPNAGVIAFADPTVHADGTPVDSGRDRLDDATSFDDILTGDVQIDAHTLNYAWDINEVLTFNSITGYRDVDVFNQTAQVPNASILNMFTIVNGITNTSFNQFSQEFQLLGETEAFTWVGGLYYYEDESEDDNTGNSNGSENIPAGDLTDHTTTENTSLAAFGQATWSPLALEQRWHFTVGTRFSSDNRKAHRNNNRVSYGFAGSPSTVPAFVANYDKDFTKFNPSFTVEYDLSDFSRVYGKVVTAYKSGGTSQRSTSQANFEKGFDEEELVSYELGYKGDLADGRVRFNAALFYMTYDDYQQSVQTGRSPGERDFINIRDADIAGLEFDLTVAITEELTSTLSYGYLDSSFGPDTVSFLQVDDTSGSGFTQVTAELTDDLAMAPNHSASLALDYTRALSFGLLNANLNAQYQDEAGTGVDEPTGELDERTLVGAVLSLSEIDVGRGQLKVMLWGKNLFDQEYYIGNIRQDSFDSLGLMGLATFGDPRTYGMTVEYRYD